MLIPANNKTASSKGMARFQIFSRQVAAVLFRIILLGFEDIANLG